MKKRSAAQNPTTKLAPWQEKPSDAPVDGTWHLIAMKAYELYVQRGRGEGLALDDWLKAEVIVNGETE